MWVWNFTISLIARVGPLALARLNGVISQFSAFSSQSFFERRFLFSTSFFDLRCEVVRKMKYWTNILRKILNSSYISDFVNKRQISQSAEIRVLLCFQLAKIGKIRKNVIMEKLRFFLIFLHVRLRTCLVGQRNTSEYFWISLSIWFEFVDI